MTNYAKITKEVLRNLYVTKSLSIRTISRSLSCSEATVLLYMRKYKISSRPQYQWLGRKHTESSKKKMRESAIRQFKNGMPVETRKKISFAHKGKPKDYLSGRIVDPKGYIKVWSPNNPMSGKSDYVYEHRLIMSQVIGRPLTKDEIVHHKNGDKSDNRTENLELTRRKFHLGKHTSEIVCPKCDFHFSLKFTHN